MTSISNTATISKTGFTSVNIMITTIEHNADNQLSIIAIPSKGETDTKTFVIDLQRLKEAVTVDGFLLDEIEESSETKKKNLLGMLRNSAAGTGALTLQWGYSPTVDKGNKIIGGILKFGIKEIPGRVGDSFLTGKTTSTSASKLLDTGALFDTRGVTSSTIVINMTTNTIANVLAVNSETQLLLSSDIFTNTGDSYQIGLGSKTYNIKLTFVRGTKKG